jgi:predicted nucleic acid-binding protein
MQGRALVDTCVLVYLIDKTDKGKHEKAKEWLKSIEGRDNFFVSIQNLREFSSIALKKSSLHLREINELLEVFADAFGIVFDSFEDIIKANEAIGKNRKIFWDALLAATMQRHSIHIILTENTKDFKGFKGIKTINPLR